MDTIVRFGGLEPGSYEYHYDLDDNFFTAFENEDLRGGMVHFDVRLEKTTHVMLLIFSFQGIVTTECDRCLDPMEVPVEGHETLKLSVGDSVAMPNEDDIVLPEGAVEVDISQWLYEFVAVSIPLQHIHPDDAEGHSTCNPDMLRRLDERSGIAERTDGTSVIDPRWAKLKDLK